MSQVMRICEDKFTHTTEEYRKLLCEKLKRMEREYMEAERVFDYARAKFFIPFESGSDESDTS
jgi:hypothetical protein